MNALESEVTPKETSAATFHTSIPYEPHIDGLRGIAVIAVIIFHAFPKLLPGGFIGVDVFFVISGYLITSIIVCGLQNKSFSVRDFYLRRIRRIFPALCLVLSATLAVGWIILLPGEWQSLGEQAATSAFFISNLFLAAGSSYFGVPAESNPFLHLWSLAIEEQFYLAWPLFLILAYRLKRNARTLFAIIAGASFLSFFAIEDRNAAFFCTASRIWELAVGGALAWCKLSLTPREESRSFGAAVLLPNSAARHLPALGLLLIATSALAFDKFTLYPGFAAVVPVLGAAFVILGRTTAPMNSHVLAARPLIAIGLISYPLYLWHWPLLALGNIVAPQSLITAVRLALIVLAALLSFGTYRLLELPARRGGSVAAIALFYFVGALGVTGYYANLGIVEPLSARQPGMVVADEARKDWQFPPPSLAPSGPYYMRPGKSPGVALIGDSNVEQFAPRLDALVASDGAGLRRVLFATHGGCLPIRRVQVDSIPTCVSFVEAAMAAALSEEVSDVVIGASWHSYFTSRNGYYFASADGTRLPIYIDGQGADEAFESLTSMIRDLQAAGKRVSLVLNIPVGPEFDPALTVPRPVIGPFLDSPETAKRRTEVESMLREVNDRLVKVAARSGASVIDPVAFLCPGETCSQFDSTGTPRYKDATHLRSSYVRREVDFLDSTMLDSGR